MVKEERHPEYFEHKPFSRWHRKKLDSKKCLATDLDFIEYRRNRGIVALLEVKQKGGLYTFQRTIFTELSERSGIPFFFIRHNKELTKFEVYRITKDEEEVVEPFPMNEKEFKEFMEAL